MVAKDIYNVNMQRGFAVFPMLFLILIIGGIVVGYLYFNKSTPPTLVKPVEQNNNLKTYSNGNLGFQFLYSKDLQVLEDSEEEFNKRGHGDFRKNFTSYVEYAPGELIEAVAVLDKENNFDKNPFTVWVFDNPKNLDIDNWYKNYWYYPFVWGDFTYTGKFSLAPKDEATISGQMAKSGIIDYQPGKPKFVYLTRNGKMYLFRIISQTGEQILSTINFLK